MAGKRKNKKKEVEYEELEYDEDVSNKISTSIIAIIIFALGLISLLALFSLSGRFGIFLDRILSLGFGWAKWFFPILLIILSIALYKQRSFFPKAVNYIGLFLFFIFIPVLFHFFFKDSITEIKAQAGLGGGYLGFYLSLFFKNILGFWGGLIIILAFLIVASILLFNITLSHLFGSKSFIYKFFNSFGDYSKKENEESDYDELSSDNEEDMEEDTGEEDDEEDLFEEENEEGQGILFTKKEIKSNNDRSDVIVKDIKKDKEINWKTKKIKIDLPLDLLSNKIGKATSGDIENNILIIQRTLENFGISVEMGQVNVGPTVTQYTFKPSEGIKVSRITALSNDLSLALAAHPIRIEAPIPGKSLIGIEVPNKSKAIVGLREVLEDKDFKLRQSNLTAALGKDVSGRNIVYDIAKMPHLLVAGATNSGKSVCLNTVIVSLLYQNNPADLRFIMVDPKRVELPIYNGIPHLLTPVITDVSKTINALRWCLNEMDRRYEVLNQASKKNIQVYNKNSKEKMPYIIFIIDELADLMVAASKDIEGSVIRLTQMSRAVGIHLILATQRPSVDVITGLIKANTPSRIAFSVASAVDSKTILDSAGAEKLLGRGDMLFTTAELSKPRRIQGAYVDDSEILAIVNFIKEKYGLADYLEGIVERQKVNGIAGVGLDGRMGDEDELLEEAKEIVISAGKASTSFLQRRLRIGYSRAASILDMLEENGIVGPSNGSKPREITISKEEYENNIADSLASSSIHNKNESKAPDNYLYADEEDSLVFESQSEDTEEEDDDDEEENININNDINDLDKNVDSSRNNQNNNEEEDSEEEDSEEEDSEEEDSEEEDSEEEDSEEEDSEEEDNEEDDNEEEDNEKKLENKENKSEDNAFFGKYFSK